MGYSIDPISANCYLGTTVLINKLDIRDEETLREAETLVTFINASKLEQHPFEGARLLDSMIYYSTSGVLYYAKRSAKQKVYSRI